MVLVSRIEGGAQVLSAATCKTIQSIKEIVKIHSDADIYLTLKETNMDPNETAQKLLNQDPFHEVKRKRDRKKENYGNKSSVPPPRKNSVPTDARENSVLVEPKKTIVGSESRKNTKVALTPMTHNANSHHNTRRTGFALNYVSDAGAVREFRVVRDNRVNQNASADSKANQISASTVKEFFFNGSSNSAGSSVHQNCLVGNSSQSLNMLCELKNRQTKNATSGGNSRKELPIEKKRLPTQPDVSLLQKANDPLLHSINSSNSSILGVCSSSSDPVHVPPLNSRVADNGAIRREVGVVGPRQKLPKNLAKPSSPQNLRSPNMQSEQEDHSKELIRTIGGVSKCDDPSKNVTPESVPAGQFMGRSFSSMGGRHHQVNGHQKVHSPYFSKRCTFNEDGEPTDSTISAAQFNKEWKPKSIRKPSPNGPGVIGASAKSVKPSSKNPKDLIEEPAPFQDNMLQLNISKHQNVTLAANIRVSEADRCQLTFGSLGTELVSMISANERLEVLLTEPSGSVPGSENSGDELIDGKHLEMVNVSIRNSVPNSPASGGGLPDHRPVEEKELSSPHDMDNYDEVQLVGDNSHTYTGETLQRPNTSKMYNSFLEYDPQHMAYNMPYFQPMVDETNRGLGLPTSQEVLISQTTNAVPASTIAMVQQQQLAQMYPHLHYSHFSNVMPYRQFVSPVYGPPIPVPSYSNNPGYSHPSNGSSYLFMPGNNSHLTPGGLKYSIQQLKPIHAGSPTAFVGSFSSPTGYAVSTPGVVASAMGHEDPTRGKYKDSLYVSNPQGETSEIWMNPRAIPNASFYNIPGQTTHAYLPSQSGHTSFNAAVQSSHMQFPGMYHQPQQQVIPNHTGSNVGGPQVGTYQQPPQLGHGNWQGSF